jgi:hypothetical protein
MEIPEEYRSSIFESIFCDFTEGGAEIQTYRNIKL